MDFEHPTEWGEDSAKDVYIYRNARARGIVFLFNASRASLTPNGVRLARDIFLSIEYLLISLEFGVKWERDAERDVAVGTIEGDALLAKFAKEAVGTDKDVEVLCVETTNQTTCYTCAGKAKAQ